MDKVRTLNQFLQVALLFSLVNLVFTQEEVYNQHHLCAKVMNGDYSHLRLQSIYSYGNQFIVFLENDRKYLVDLANVKPTTVKITDAGNKGFLPWEANELQSVHAKIDLSDRGNVSSIYTFSNAWNEIGGGTMSVLFTGVSMQYWLTVNPSSPKVERVEPASKYSFSIISNGSLQGGFVFSPDFATRHEDFAMYDLQFLPQNNHKPMIWDEHMPSHIRSQVLFYYMEATDNPNTTRLVSGASRDPDQRADIPNRMFLQLPIGFKYQYGTYLFDTQIGCVYIFRQLDKPLAQLAAQFGAGQPILLGRQNIPFEKFFICDRVYEDKVTFPRDRCEHTNRWNSPRASMPGYNSGRWSFWQWMLMLVVVAILGLLVAAVVKTVQNKISSDKKSKKRTKRGKSKNNKRKRKEKKSVRKSTLSGMGSLTSSMLSSKTSNKSKTATKSRRRKAQKHSSINREKISSNLKSTLKNAANSHKEKGSFLMLTSSQSLSKSNKSTDGLANKSGSIKSGKQIKSKARSLSYLRKITET